MALDRHQLVRLAATAWQTLGTRAWDPQAGACIAHWAAHDLPLVVTRQRSGAEGICLGLPAPLAFGRRRLAIELPTAALARADAFPLAECVEPLLRPPLHAAWRDLSARLGDLGCATRVYGGHGWQILSGLAYLHAASDLDLLLPVGDAATADAVADALAAVRWEAPRLDGELIFPDGAGIAWREWQRWRCGRAEQVLVKRLHGVALEAPLRMCA